MFKVGQQIQSIGSGLNYIVMDNQSHDDHVQIQGNSRDGEWWPAHLFTETGHFMCHVEGARGPKKVHETPEQAIAEAMRLACFERGKNVYVLKAVAVVKAEKPVLPEAVVTKL